MRWKYRVHEQILPALRRAGGEVCFTDVRVQHVGYQDPALRGRPIAIGAYGVDAATIVSSSREARDLGIKTGMKVFEAKAKVEQK